MKKPGTLVFIGAALFAGVAYGQLTPSPMGDCMYIDWNRQRSGSKIPLIHCTDLDPWSPVKHDRPNQTSQSTLIPPAQIGTPVSTPANDDDAMLVEKLIKQTSSKELFWTTDTDSFLSGSLVPMMREVQIWRTKAPIRGTSYRAELAFTLGYADVEKQEGLRWKRQAMDKPALVWDLRFLDKQGKIIEHPRPVYKELCESELFKVAEAPLTPQLKDLYRILLQQFPRPSSTKGMPTFPPSCN